MDTMEYSGHASPLLCPVLSVLSFLVLSSPVSCPVLSCSVLFSSAHYAFIFSEQYVEDIKQAVRLFLSSTVPFYGEG
jgi:hypothetical protein